MSNSSRHVVRVRKNGFSLIELVIVVVIIAIIGAIAIPKMSRGASGAADSALVQNLSVLRSAIDLYQTEHGGSYPTAAAINDALLKYTDDQGAINGTGTKDATHIYGPYLRSVPTLPVGAKKGQNGIDIAANSATATVGWIYDPALGTMKANTTTEQDAKNIAYNTY